MKKIYAIILVVFMSTSLFAQQREITGMQEVQIKENPAFTSGKVTGTVDTLDMYLQRATAFFILTAGPQGYVLGTNDFSSKIGNHFDALGSTTVTEVMAYFVHKVQMGGFWDDFQVEVYEAGADSMPTTLNSTGFVNGSAIDTSGGPTYVAMSSPTAMGGDFFVSMTYGDGGLTIDDTLALVSSNPTTQAGGPDGNFEKRGRQYVDQNSAWMRLYDIWTIGGGQFNADVMLFPIVDFDAVAIDPQTTSNGLTLRPSYPNPASDVTNLRYSIDQPSDVNISVWDVKGQIVFNQTMQKSSGDHEAHLNLSNLAAGKYYYKIATDKAFIMSRFMVAK